MRTRWVSLAVTSLLTIGSSAQSQSLLYKPAPEPKAVPQQSSNCNVTIPFAQFAGKKIVFLAKTVQFQRYGYQSWHFQGVSYPSPSYQDLAGKIGTIVSIDMSKGEDAMFKDVVVRMDDDGRLVTTQALHNTISEVIFLNDIDFVKSHYVGKMLWIKTRSVRTTQDVEAYDGIKVRKFSGVKIVGVVPGTFQYDPLDFVIQTDGGQQALVPTAVSNTNVSSDMISSYQKVGTEMCRFNKAFLTENPRTKYSWAEAIWRNIELERVVVGMTLEQVIMSKGEPRAFNETKTANTYSAQLVYENNVYIYINERNVVTAIQE